MRRLRDPQWALVILFLALIGAVPLVQALIEFPQEDGVRALEVFSEWPSAENLRNYEHNMEKAAWAARVSRPWLQFAQFRWLAEGGEKVVHGQPGWYFYKPGLGYMLRREKADTNDPVGAIVHFRDQLAGQGIKLLLMPVPNKDSIYPDRLTGRVPPGHTVLSPRTAEVLERLRAADVQVLDLFKEFGAARKNDPHLLYLRQDTHWSPVGMEVAARAAARRLVELGWIQPGRSEYAERPTNVNRLGDLVRMLQSPVLERAVQPETVAAAQVIRTSGGGVYQDQLEAEVLVLGDSFMRVYQTDAPTSAGFIAHLAREMKQPMMSLVNDGGGSTLVREELAARPVYFSGKKVVLWEFVERDLGLGIKGWRKITVPPPERLEVGKAPDRAD